MFCLDNTVEDTKSVIGFLTKANSETEWNLAFGTGQLVLTSE